MDPRLKELNAEIDRRTRELLELQKERMRLKREAK
jgi:chorismate mutase